MASNRPELATVLSTDHPARPYLVAGGLLSLYGLLRGGFGSLILLGAGGAIVKRGLDEMRRIETLHGGNVHGVNRPPIRD